MNADSIFAASNEGNPFSSSSRVEENKSSHKEKPIISVPVTKKITGVKSDASKSSTVRETQITVTSQGDSIPKEVLFQIIARLENENQQLKQAPLESLALDSTSENIKRSQNEIYKLLSSDAQGGESSKSKTRIEDIGLNTQSEFVKLSSNQISNQVSGIVETQHQVSFLQSRLDSAARANKELGQKISGLNLEMKSLVDQNEILRIENKKLIENVNRPRSKSKDFPAADSAAQQALLTTIDEFGSSEFSPRSGNLRLITERITKSLKEAIQKTYEDTVISSMRHLFYAVKEAIETVNQESLALDARLEKLSKDSENVSKETRTLVENLEKDNLILVQEKRIADETVSRLTAQVAFLKASQEASLESKAEQEKLNIIEMQPSNPMVEKIRSENEQLKLHQSHLDSVIAQWKSENVALRDQIVTLTQTPTEAVQIFKAKLEKCQEKFNKEKIKLKKAEELIKHYESKLKSDTHSRPSSPIRNLDLSNDPDIIEKRLQLSGYPTILEQVEEMVSLVKGNDVTLEQLHKLKTSVGGDIYF